MGEVLRDHQVRKTLGYARFPDPLAGDRLFLYLLLIGLEGDRRRADIMALILRLVSCFPATACESVAPARNPPDPATVSGGGGGGDTDYPALDAAGAAA